MGKDVAATGRLKLGDRVCGSADGMEGLRPQSGAFAEYASMDGGMALRMPDDMTFETGAGMGLRIATAGMALFHSMGISAELLKKPARGDEVFDVLVYGGATATGTLAIQLLKHCGLRVIATCSPQSFELVKSYGADVCFCYNSPTCGEDIRAYCGNALDYALDCITEESTLKICYQAIGRLGGKCECHTFQEFGSEICLTNRSSVDCGLEPYPEEKAASRRAVEADWILATWMRGLPISWPEPFGNAGKPECRKFAARFFPHIHPLFTSGQLRPHPTRIEPNGFEGLLDGVGLIRKGGIRGQKLVYRTADRRVPATAAA